METDGTLFVRTVRGPADDDGTGKTSLLTSGTPTRPMSEWSKFASAPTTRHPGEPVPVEAVRDLLGLARALYAARKEHGAGKAELERLALAGRRLRHSLTLASSPGPNDLAVAWWQAEQAVADLAGSVDVLMPAEWLVEASVKRVRKAK